MSIYTHTLFNIRYRYCRCNGNSGSYIVERRLWFSSSHLKFRCRTAEGFLRVFQTGRFRRQRNSEGTETAKGRRDAILHIQSKRLNLIKESKRVFRFYFPHVALTQFCHSTAGGYYFQFCPPVPGLDCGSFMGGGEAQQMKTNMCTSLAALHAEWR